MNGTKRMKQPRKSDLREWLALSAAEQIRLREEVEALLALRDTLCHLLQLELYVEKAKHRPWWHRLLRWGKA